MLLNKVKLRNFRQYYGDVEFTFATSENKNVTIIRGENGVGKTSLLNAIKWAFFGTFTTNFRNPNNLVNDTYQKQGMKQCSVEIEFIEDDTTFLLIRSYDQGSKKSNVKLFKYSGATLGASLSEPELLINTMLPKEMAEYFFFQGEGSNAVNIGNKGGNLAESIRDILGFKVANTLIKDLETLSKILRTKISNLDTTGEATKLTNQIEMLETSLTTQNEKKFNGEAILPELESRMEKIEEELNLIENTDLQSLRIKESELIKETQSLKEKLIRLKTSKLKIISKCGWAVFGYDFANSSLDFIDESQLKGRLPEPYNETFIKDILNCGLCICGTELKITSDGYLRITEMLNKASNPELLQRLSGIRAQIQDIKTNYEHSTDLIKSNLQDTIEAETLHQEKTKSLAATRAKISEIPEFDIQKLQQQKKILRTDINELQRSIGSADVRIETIKNQITEVTKKLKDSIPDTKLIEALNIKKQFIDEMTQILNNHLSKTEENIRLHVLSEVNKTLDKFSRHDFKIKVDKKDFTFILLDKDDNIVGQGDGLNLLLNLTITSSLINFAASRKTVKDPILSSATVAPLIIDAPFGVLDNKYRNVVVNQLPKQTRQIIFLVSSSQWSDEMDDEIRDLIGEEYALILEETAPQGNKELDVIKVQGKDMVVSRYDCDIDRTVVESIL